LLRSLEPRTRKNYGTRLLRFTQFCNLRGIPESQRMPASDALLTTFVAEWSGKVAKTTVESWLAGLSFWHTLNEATWHGGHMLCQILKTIPKKESEKGKKCPPIMLEHLCALRDRLDMRNTFDAAVFAMACVAFWCCRRLGELVIPSKTLFNLARHVVRGAKLGFKCTSGGGEYVNLHLPWTKKTGTKGFNIPITNWGGETASVPAVRQHFEVNSEVPNDALFFAFATRDDLCGWAPMTCDWFLGRCSKVWEAAGLESRTGHCFQIGGATKLLLLGVPPDIVQVLGG
ncbi:hypothetical protein PHLGIDRAFT_68737, partial [Phlebiopsis gigantea 11061_1 CR5-6]